MAVAVAPPRKYTRGKRRVTLYFPWSYPAECNRPLSEMNDRMSTLWEVRKQAWPKWEWAADPNCYDQGIAGCLELVFLDSFAEFQNLVGEVTGHPVPLLQRVDHAGKKRSLDDGLLEDVDTLIIASLEHSVTDQVPTMGEIDAVRNFLAREGTCLVVCPHHDIGLSDDITKQEMERQHHGDMLISIRESFGLFGRCVLDQLGIPVVNRYGLSPARDPKTREPLPLAVAADLDTHGLLMGVTTLNAHAHLPHYALTSDSPCVHVLARQKINPAAAPHPFTIAGNTEWNAVVWAPPGGERAGDVLIADATTWTTSLFGGTESLHRLWANLATTW
jgi:hypothetical protein